MRLPSTFIFAFGLILFLSSTAAALADETWESTLRLQLEDEKRCQLQTFVSVRELPMESLGGLEGRVRCVDGREFDFSRQKSHQKFELRLCQPAVC